MHHPKHPEILRELADVMAGSLALILGAGEVPAGWKPVNVIPIYRKSVRKDPGAAWSDLVCSVLFQPGMNGNTSDLNTA